jgi:hypothetical protein
MWACPRPGSLVRRARPRSHLQCDRICCAPATQFGRPGPQPGRGRSVGAVRPLVAASRRLLARRPWRAAAAGGGAEAGGRASVAAGARRRTTGLPAGANGDVRPAPAAAVRHEDVRPGAAAAARGAARGCRCERRARPRVGRALPGGSGLAPRGRRVPDRGAAGGRCAPRAPHEGAPLQCHMGVTRLARATQRAPSEFTRATMTALSHMHCILSSPFGSPRLRAAGAQLGRHRGSRGHPPRPCAARVEATAR